MRPVPRRERHVLHGAFLLALIGVLLASPVDSSANHQLYANLTYDLGNWNNVEEAEGWDPGEADCECDRHQTAWNDDDQTYLWLTDWRSSPDGPLFSLGYGELITSVKMNCHGRYRGEPGGGFRYRVQWNLNDLGYVSPDNTFSNNEICRWRIPDASQNITPLWDWNSNPDDPFDLLEVGVRRRGNPERMFVNAVRLSVRTAGIQASAPVVFTGDELILDFNEIFGNCIVGGTYEAVFTLDAFGDDPVSSSVGYPLQNPDFQIIHGAGNYSLNPGEQHQVRILFTPSSTAWNWAGFSLGVRDLLVKAEGQAVCPQLSTGLADDRYDFGEVDPGSEIHHTFSIHNTSTVAQSGFVAMLENESGDFQIVHGAGAYQLSPGESLPVTVGVAPTSTNPLLCRVGLGNCAETVLTFSTLGPAISSVIPGLPQSVELHSPSPNPSSGSTSIAYSIPSAQGATIQIFDIKGRLVKNLVDGNMDAGHHLTIWDGLDSAGREVPAGVYFARLVTKNAVYQEKMLRIER